MTEPTSPVSIRFGWEDVRRLRSEIERDEARIEGLRSEVARHDEKVQRMEAMRLLLRRQGIQETVPTKGSGQGDGEL